MVLCAWFEDGRSQILACFAWDHRQILRGTVNRKVAE